MRLKLFSVAILAATVSYGAANAQSARDLSAPRELPPSTFAGQQYVDSRGCVFLRAGIGGRVNWVPRVTRDRSQLCGYPPTFGNNQVAIADPAPDAKAPQAQVVKRKPMDTVASISTPPKIRATQGKGGVPAATYAAPTVVMAQPPVRAEEKTGKPVVQVAKAGAAQSGIACYKDAPVAQRFRVQGGGTIVLCTTDDGSLEHARPPRVLAGPAAVAPSGYLEVRAPALRPTGGKTTSVAAASQGQTPLPKGFKAAFKDDRFNPKRGQGTAQGWADQDQVWTREVPARLVADQAGPKGKTVIVRKVSVSTKSDAKAATPVAKGRSYVQIGTFGQPANAAGASSRLAGLGLPVARSKITKGGKALQIVMAGPFASAQDAQAALSAARRAGFADAFIR